MKTIKHLFVLCILLFFAFTPVYANENENTYIYDDAELLTTEQHQTLYTEMDRISKTYQCSIHIVTIDDQQLPYIPFNNLQKTFMNIIMILDMDTIEMDTYLY